MILYWLLYLILFVPQESLTESIFNLYNTDHLTDNPMYYDCLLHDTLAAKKMDPSIPRKMPIQYQIIPYCVRPSNSTSNQLINDEKSFNHGISIRFERLKQENITSQQLYSWSAPIDLVEQYEEYLEKSNSLLSSLVFNNCSVPWFGKYCQYSFNLICPFDLIVDQYFETINLHEIDANHKITCYTFIKCNRGPSPSCLDWREICDGKIDCLDGGEDEIDCEQLDQSECKDDEFRCNSGFCIPKLFFNDNDLSYDCNDDSDETAYRIPHFTSGKIGCPSISAFRCEETKCLNEHFLSCGNGQCISSYPCENDRDRELKKAILSRESNLLLSFECWESLLCLPVRFDDREYINQSLKCSNIHQEHFQERCPSLFFFPAYPIVLNHVRFVYATNLSNHYENNVLLPHYICYDQELCDWLPATVIIYGFTCRHISELKYSKVADYFYSFEYRISTFFRKCSTKKRQSVECPKSKSYRCRNSSKCIALNKLNDGFSDCFQDDDEQITNSCSLPDVGYRFRCDSETKCIPMRVVGTDKPLCVSKEDEKYKRGQRYSIFYLSFPSLCDGFVDHSRIDGVNYTDEMDCQDWPCNNVYTRCDGKWNCHNAADEADCPDNPCRPNGHPCISTLTRHFTCLPLSRINDGIIDCLGGFDERDRCEPIPDSSVQNTYRCFNETRCILDYSVCASYDEDKCSTNYDRDLWCFYDSNSTHTRGEDVWRYRLLNFYENASWYLGFQTEIKVIYTSFKLKNHLVYPRMENVTIDNSLITRISTTTASSFSFNKEIVDCKMALSKYNFSVICKRGIPIYRNNLMDIICLCPPGYFGYRCEYQSQRVSLKLRFRVIEWRTIFTFVVLLVDKNENIHSSEQIDYLSVRDCEKQFNIYLLYSVRPIPVNQTFHIRIDVYDKEKLEYYVSMFYPILYSFLPVHRLSLPVFIPVREVTNKMKVCPLKCLHGQCRSYFNSDRYFCQCLNGYSGILCKVKNLCSCSSDSICVGVENNRSICLCPTDTFGPRCYLKRTACISKPCSNTSQSITNHEQYSETEYFCRCSPDYTGSLCEKLNRNIELHFDKSISIPELILIHFVYVSPDPELYFTQMSIINRPLEPKQITMISKIKFHESSALVYYEGEFHLIFVEFDEDYYMALLQNKSVLSTNISTTIIPQHRCLSIKKFLANDIQVLPRWHRVKSYHTLCKKDSNLACFYDNDYFMCLCNIDRHANCFKYDFSHIYDCFGYNYCENDGRCFLDNRTYPTTSSCLCKECYFGSRCQFTSTGFGLSIDEILGYLILPNVHFSKQPAVVKISTGLTVVMIILAIINGVLSIITFRTKSSLQIGCGLYMLSSSITSCLIMTMFSYQFLILILSQMLIITKHDFLRVNCIMMNILLKSFLDIGDWLNACVSVERVLTIKMETKFNKIKSKKIAKWIIFGIYIFTLASYIHDPLHRYLLEDNEEQRKWCVLRYSSSIKIYASFINIFHFALPLLSNLISILLIIIVMARQKLKVTKQDTLKNHLCKQFQQHQHRLLSSLMLIIIAVPRLVISFLSDCMKSARNPWLYLTGYFISFFPSLLLFIIFVLPSKFYRKEFNDATVHIKKTIQRRFRWKNK